ncbi:MAG TPA: fluoride efflux transporter CrcB [Hanamia sp.]|nr:fluoride efflux transporter CrcB [Hanamia sp.]
MYRYLIYVIIGSSIGGAARYLSQEFVQKNFPSYIPFGTLSVNIVGSFIIGIIYALAEKSKISAEVRILIATGFCGGFTTFSSFAFENIKLLQDGEFFNTALYVVLSLAIGFVAVYLGILFTRLIF